jgi:branched-chain amino acid transport system substrate-binding protein
MSGEMQTFGQEIYNGAVIAAEIYRDDSGRKLKLTPYDTKGDPVEAARIVGELARTTTTDVIIGPLTSDESMVSSAVLNCSSLPLIAPAATEAGLTRLSSVSFQLAPNGDLEGVTLATFAARNLGADSVAIISSTAADHLRMTRAFAEHFEKMGGKVVATEYYRQRDTDFGAYIRDIKAVLIGQHDDSTFFINANGDTLDLDIIPASVDCIFVPGDSRQLKQLIPQINFYNLSGQYLGSDGWGDETVYKLGDNITKGAVFSSPFLEGRQSEQYVKLAVAYDSRYGSRPPRLSALGYDAVSLVTMAAAEGATTRDDILSRLASVSGYEGASGRVTFGEYRENIEMPLYRIESGQAVMLSGRRSTSDDAASDGP